MRNAVLGHPMTFAEADGGVVNDSIEAPERVDLGCQVLRSGDGAELADHDRFGLGQGFLCVRRAGVVARVQDDLMSLIGEKLPDHEAKAIGRTGDEDARHAVVLTLHLPIQRGRCAPAQRACSPDSARAFSAPS